MELAKNKLNGQGETVRFMLYNIRYGAGVGRRFHLPLPYSGYLKQTNGHFDKIADFIKLVGPDVIGLIEVDTGSYRTQNSNQAEIIARAMRYDCVYRSKYSAKSIAQRLPVVNKQGNAILTNQKIKSQQFHYLRSGVKRLVIELELANFTVFLVHLSLGFRKRHSQLQDLQSMVANAQKPVIVAGDFNVFWGAGELQLFLSETGLQNVNYDGKPSHPSRAPRRQLDFILCSPQIETTDFIVPQLGLSDHVPLICDFKINGH